MPYEILYAAREVCTTCRRDGCSLLRYIEQDREIMTRASGENEEMKNFMTEGNLFVEGIERDPDGVRQAAANHHDQTTDREDVRQGTDGHNDEPAH